VIFGFDIDGTISAAPEVFAAIMEALLERGHEVHVITGQTREVTNADVERRVAQLAALGIFWGQHFDKLHLAGAPDWIADKAAYCRDHKVDFMFEDSVLYAKAISAWCPVTVMYGR
jgi:hypothetical protein